MRKKHKYVYNSVMFYAPQTLVNVPICDVMFPHMINFIQLGFLYNFNEILNPKYML